jgi:dTDP-4-dehydrorhamnose 3,5-epimerase-like enzyme
MVNDDGSYAYCNGSTSPYWQDYGSVYYIAGQPYINQRDINFNSPTYGQTRSVPLY